MSKVTTGNPNDCWLWNGTRLCNGYAQIVLGGSSPQRRNVIRIQRASWLVHRGSIPPGMIVLSTCGNRLCVNPAHLKLGTRRDRKLPPPKSLRERFETKVDRSAGPDGCWLWTASTVLGGYGQIAIGDRRTSNLMAHRVSYELHVGPIPPGKIVMHTCDNKLCVNPTHLRVGTQKDNIADMVAKGRDRHNPARGMRAGLAKLTDRDVRAIRARYASSMAKQADLAAEFGVSQSTISSIIRRQTWTHI